MPIEPLDNPVAVSKVTIDTWEKAKIISTIVSAVVIPLVLIWIGNGFTSSLKERELQGKFVELAVQILREEPSKQAGGLREWATQVMNKYSGVPLSNETQKALIERLPLPASAPMPSPKQHEEQVALGGKTGILGEADASRLMAEVVKVASLQVGVKEVPPDTNRGPEVEKYLRSVGLPPGTPWNVAFVYWCYMQASQKSELDNPLPKTGGTIDMWIRAKGLRLINAAEIAENVTKIRPGIIFTINRGRGIGHVGIVESISGELITTVEGNTDASPNREGGGVYRRQRKITEISGLISVAP